VHCGKFTGAPTDAPVEELMPARAATAASDVVVPLLQAVGCGVAAAMLAGVAAWWLTWPAWTVWVTGCAVASVAWFRLLSSTRESLWAVRHTGQAAPVAAAPQTVRVELSDHDVEGRLRSMRLLDLPIDDVRLRQFARAATGGAGLGVHSWTGGGRPFTRTEYELLTDALQGAGWLAPARGNRPRRLTAAGRSLLRQMFD
jgi:hypothetical protein